MDDKLVRPYYVISDVNFNFCFIEDTEIENQSVFRVFDERWDAIRYCDKIAPRIETHVNPDDLRVYKVSTNKSLKILISKVEKICKERYGRDVQVRVCDYPRNVENAIDKLVLFDSKIILN